ARLLFFASLLSWCAVAPRSFSLHHSRRGRRALLFDLYRRPRCPLVDSCSRRPCQRPPSRNHPKSNHGKPSCPAVASGSLTTLLSCATQERSPEFSEI